MLSEIEGRQTSTGTLQLVHLLPVSLEWVYFIIELESVNARNVPFLHILSAKLCGRETEVINVTKLVISVSVDRLQTAQVDGRLLRR